MRALWLLAALLLSWSVSASYWQGQPLTNEWQQYLAVSAKLLAQDAAALAAGLREHGVIVRHFKQARIAQFLRISIGTPEQNQALLDALAVCLA